MKENSKSKIRGIRLCKQSYWHKVQVCRWTARCRIALGTQVSKNCKRSEHSFRRQMRKHSKSLFLRCKVSSQAPSLKPWKPFTHRQRMNRLRKWLWSLSCRNLSSKLPRLVEPSLCFSHNTCLEGAVLMLTVPAPVRGLLVLQPASWRQWSPMASSFWMLGRVSKTDLLNSCFNHISTKRVPSFILDHLARADYIRTRIQSGKSRHSALLLDQEGQRM